MAVNDTPVMINIELDRQWIRGSVEGTADSWVFKCDSEYFCRLVGDFQLAKQDIPTHKHRYNLTALDTAITEQVKQLEEGAENIYLQ